MITGIVLENFKCFEKVEIHPKRVTCFVGANGTGKSSVLQAFGLLKQRAWEIENNPDTYNGRNLVLSGPLLNLKNQRDIFRNFELRPRVSIKGSFSVGRDEHPFSYSTVVSYGGIDNQDQEEHDITILHAPFLHFEGQEDGLNSDAVIVLHLTEGLIVIAGTAYAGEMKKSVFTAMNYYLPLSGVLSLHSAANIDPATGKTAFFFGLSGTGKTTLSTDPDRVLIGDDEHAWTKDGIFNIEGGCYAKVIRLSEEAEPDIFATAHMFGTIMENVIFDEDSRVADLDDDAITENTRSSYPLDSLRNRYQGQVAPHPAHVILLTADAFGVLPPLARLTHDQALYHFLSGYTSKLAGTETGIDEPQVTFSTCFGAPFMALQPTLYADLLKERLEATGPGVWLVNTGWVGGPPGVGERVAIQETRKMVSAILNDAMVAEEFRTDPLFGFEVPLHCPGADASLLNPRDLWSDKDAYDVAYRALAERFHDNFDQFRPVAPPEVVTAGP